MAELIGKGFVNDNKGFKDQTGDWVVDVAFIETNYYDDNTTKEERIEVRVMDSDFQLAHEAALGAALRQMREEVYDLGLQSLIDAREKARLNAKSESDKTTNA